MKRIKSLLTAISIFATTTFSAIALPGVTQMIPDQSGQFVYYKDNTFTRESYVGIVYFDESTYGLRYYAPAIEKEGKPEMKMQVYVTIDEEKAKEKAFIEFTGEKVEPIPRSQEETDIINYLHDIIYEMFPRRIKFGDVTKINVMNDDYEQFGGRVSIEFDPIIPVLNLSKIVTSDGKIALTAVTGGKLTSSNDTSFISFKGIPAKIASENGAKVKKSKATSIEIENEGVKTQVFNLDSNWEQKSAASWMLDDNAFVSTIALPISKEQKNALLRSLILGRNHSYSDWSKLKILEKDNMLSINQVVFDSESNLFKYDFKKIANLDENTKSIFTLTVFANSYAKNKSYYEKILNSYNLK